jgi:hydrogenase-4 component E
VSLDIREVIALGAAFFAILMMGTTVLRLNLTLFSLQAFLIAAETACFGWTSHNNHLYLVAGSIALIKALAVPQFLGWIVKRINVQSDAGSVIPIPISMHLSIVLLGISYLLAQQLPGLPEDPGSRMGATAAMSLLFSGVLLMLTRRVALSQIIGFLVIENGVYLFALTQTQGMPMIVEMGVLLDVLVGVMITGLLLFRIQRSFEHIDVTQLKELHD